MTAERVRANQYTVDHDNRRTDLTWMADHGECAEGAARRLGISVQGLAQWCRRYDTTGRLYERLRARDPLQFGNNQYDDPWRSR